VRKKYVYFSIAGIVAYHGVVDGADGFPIDADDVEGASNFPQIKP
jgi:hypothetical protein